jgi:hypothetical protein
VRGRGSCRAYMYRQVDLGYERERGGGEAARHKLSSATTRQMILCATGTSSAYTKRGIRAHSRSAHWYDGHRGGGSKDVESQLRREALRRMRRPWLLALGTTRSSVTSRAPELECSSTGFRSSSEPFPCVGRPRRNPRTLRYDEESATTPGGAGGVLTCPVNVSRVRQGARWGRGREAHIVLRDDKTDGAPCRWT